MPNKFEFVLIQLLIPLCLFSQYQKDSIISIKTIKGRSVAEINFTRGILYPTIGNFQTKIIKGDTLGEIILDTAVMDSIHTLTVGGSRDNFWIKDDDEINIKKLNLLFCKFRYLRTINYHLSDCYPSLTGNFLSLLTHGIRNVLFVNIEMYGQLPRRQWIYSNDLHPYFTNANVNAITTTIKWQNFPINTNFIYAPRIQGKKGNPNQYHFQKKESNEDNIYWGDSDWVFSLNRLNFLLHNNKFENELKKLKPAYMEEQINEKPGMYMFYDQSWEYSKYTSSHELDISPKDTIGNHCWNCNATINEFFVFPKFFNNFEHIHYFNSIPILVLTSENLKEKINSIINYYYNNEALKTIEGPESEHPFTLIIIAPDPRYESFTIPRNIRKFTKGKRKKDYVLENIAVIYYEDYLTNRPLEEVKDKNYKRLKRVFKKARISVLQ